MRRWAKSLAVTAALAAPFAAAQDAVEPGADDNGFIIGLIENQLSTETRKIRLSGVDGILSSQATVRRITISDPEGVWLRIDNAEIDWNRSALLRGALEINRLAAERISAPRPPVPDEGLPDPAARSVSVPDLPISVRLGALEIGSVALGEALIGFDAEVSVAGRMALAGGGLDAALTVDRLDGPGGAFEFAVVYDNAEQTLDLDLSVDEPANGIFANLLSIEGRPPVALTVRASGPVRGIVAEIDLRAAGEDMLDGLVTVSDRDGLLGVEVDVTGRIQPLVASSFRPFFAEESAIRASGRQRAGGGFDLSDVSISSGGLRLTGTARTADDGFLEALALNAEIGSADGAPIVLPVPGGKTRLRQGRLTVSYGTGETWTGALTLSGLEAGSIRMPRVALEMGGAAENLRDPARRRITARLDGAATGVTSTDPDLAAALGDRISLLVDLGWEAGRPLDLRLAQIRGNGLSAGLNGTLEGFVFDGEAAVSAADLAPFSDLFGRDMAGRLRASLAGTVNLLTRGFDLALDGASEGLRLGIARLDPLIGGETVLEGRLARDEAGLTADGFRLANDEVEITATGIYSATETDFRLDAAIADLGRVSPDAAGRATLEAVATGGPDRLALSALLSLPEGKIGGREVQGFGLGFDGAGTGLARLEGTIRGSARLGDAPVTLSGGIALRDDVLFLREFVFLADRTRFRGNLARGADGLVAGSVDISSPDISTAAALFFLEATGAVETRLMLSRERGRQRAALTGELRGLAVGGARLGAADLDLVVHDLFGVPLADGNLVATNAQLAGFALETLRVASEIEGPRSNFVAAARLVNGTSVDLAGYAENLAPGVGVGLERFTLVAEGARAELAAPGTLEIRGTEIRLSPLELAIDGGRLMAEGTIGAEIALSLRLADLPVSIVNTVLPALELAGTVSGEADMSGPRDSPAARFDLSATGLSAAATTARGLPPADLTVKGALAGGIVRGEATLVAGSAIAATVSGAVPLSPRRRGLDLTATVKSLSLSLLEPVAGVAGLDGNATGFARITGRITDPEGSFSVNGTGLTAQLLRDNGIGAAEVSATGAFRDGIVELAEFRLRADGNIRLDASGRIPLTGSGLKLSVDGRVPLSALNVALARSQSQLAGVMELSTSVSGSLAAPEFAGRASVAGATFVNAPLNLRLEQITIDAALAGQRVEFRGATASLSGGGRVALEGGVSTDAERGFPADLRLDIRNAVYSDGEVVTTRLDGELAYTGPLAGDGLISGTVDVRRTEIVIPSRFGINEGVLLDVMHRGARPEVVLTLDRAGLADGLADRPPAANPALDIRIRAPNQIFIRGRGLDAEMGGEILLRGTLSDPEPVGQIALIRGRLSLLGERFDFDEGTVTLAGNLDPEIRLLAETEAGDGTAVFIAVEGAASDPEISFTSAPSLPQDEVLALLIFDRNVTELSPFQVAQLASAVATLAGGGEGVTGRLRSNLGLADLDIVGGEEGGVGVRAGAYLDENIYLDVETLSAGESKATINLDITESVRARASVDSRGESSVGIFFERDY